MALLIENILENGIPTKYHRIISAEADYKANKLVVQVSSYVGENQRKAEINASSNIESLRSMRSRINELVADPTEKNEPERQELSEKINAFVDEHGEPVEKDFGVALKTIELDISEEKIEDFSRTNIYKLLKKKGQFFEGATKA